MAVLITGFEPFGGLTVNPSAQLAEALASEATIAILPVEFDRGVALIQELIDQHRPDVVLSLGVAADRTALEIERVALNLADATIPDNAGYQPIDEPIVPGEPAAYFASLPVKTMLAAARAENISAKLSFSAGSYCCNAVMYAALEFAARMPEKIRPRCGFVHVPPFSALPFDQQLRALKAMLAVTNETEQHYAAGTLN